MNPSRMSALGAGGDGQWVSGGPETPWQGRARPDAARRDTRRRRAREPYEASPEAQSSQRRIRRETERQRSLRTACTLMSVTSLTPACGPELLLTKYQRLSQLVRYTAFLEDATSALVRGCCSGNTRQSSLMVDSSVNGLANAQLEHRTAAEFAPDLDLGQHRFTSPHSTKNGFGVLVGQYLAVGAGWLLGRGDEAVLVPPAKHEIGPVALAPSPRPESACGQLWNN
ncbi:uncharacterized protein LOC122390669 isoform X1 [Amphibalanus amphitrite]|uniref:uncharacterized protein LOC122390669 isoform X1 n=1 Tax=Amphibalanus amphitrite TaxID=1232801 RepID=UPI001C924158|nr:uncharacterized protein LOC122390669 isoform X1 [Amphibalanus amphitrite]XP_043239766.1 uncharacterized protein LOC122390669 isoform X1 [Amphibalanus amphitrite]